jgi:2-keto-4-pentenoate hydratase/2-oxohepta-3-ene-1,7-dioic acid hydratase in catechol pathway
MRYLAPGASDPAVGVTDGDLVAEVPASGGDLGPLLLMDRAGLERIASASMVTHNPADVRLLTPVRRPGKILALAANYHPHETELEIDLDVETPRVFIKPATALLGPDDPIPYHSVTGDLVEEIELGVVIGRPGKDISIGRALDHVFGYTIINDVSARSLRFSPERADDPGTHWFDWLNGKWLDGHCPVGPWIVHSSSLPEPGNLAITTRINGEVYVQGNTSRMKFDIPRQIAYISRLCTLEPGDLIATGVVPLGAGEDEVMLKPGDLIEGAVEGIGTLRNTVVSAGGQ